MYLTWQKFVPSAEVFPLITVIFAKLLILISAYFYFQQNFVPVLKFISSAEVCPLLLLIILPKFVPLLNASAIFYHISVKVCPLLFCQSLSPLLNFVRPKLFPHSIKIKYRKIIKIKYMKKIFYRTFYLLPIIFTGYFQWKVDARVDK